MTRVRVEEVEGIEAYERVREEFRRRVIEARRRRRVELGDQISVAFENHDTVLFQIQEMIRAERISAPEQVRFEVDVYNALLGDQDSLGATLFIEVTERERIKAELDKFQGLDRERRLYLEIGDGAPISAEFEPGHSTEDRISAVHYIRFPLSPDARRTFLDLEARVQLVADHPSYKARAELSEVTRLALAEDLVT